MATFIMRPNGTVSNAWTVVNAATAHEALDDAVEQPTAGSTADGYIETATQNTLVDLDTISPTDVDTASALEFWIEAAVIVGNRENQQAIIEIKNAGGTVLATLTTSNFTTGYQWYSVSLTGQSWTQTDVDGLRIAITSNKNGGGPADTIGVRAAYAELTYTAASSDVTVNGGVGTTTDTAQAGTTNVVANIEGSQSTTTDTASAGTSVVGETVIGSLASTTEMANVGTSSIDVVVEGSGVTTTEVASAGTPLDGSGLTISDDFESLLDGELLSDDPDWDVTLSSGTGVPTMDQHDDHSDLSQVVDMSDVGDAYAIHQTSMGNTDHHAECHSFIDTGTNNHANHVGPVVRGSAASYDAAFDGYGAFLYGKKNGITNQVWLGIFRIDNGTPTELLGSSELSATYSPNTQHMIRLDVSGSTLTAYVDGNEELQTNDATYSAGQYTGFRLFREESSIDSQPFVDNFTAATATGGSDTTVTGSSATTVDTANAGSATGGDITVIGGVATETDTANAGTAITPAGAMDNDFDGTSLDGGWTFVQNVNNDATLSVSDGFATITNPAGTSVDSISSLGSTDDTSGLVHDISGNFDVAVRIASVVAGQDSNLVGFILRGSADSEMIRWTLYGDTTKALKYGYERSGGVGNNFQGSDNLVGDWLNNNPAWMRVKRAGTSYEFYLSGDGVTWTLESSVTSDVVPETIKLSLGQYSSNLGEPLRFDEVVDLDSRGSTDARDTVPARSAGTTLNTDFTALPSWLSTESAVDGGAVIDAGRLKLNTAPADGSYGRVWLNQAGHTEAGMLVSVEMTTTDANAFAVIGMEAQDGGADIDQYTKRPWLGFEMQMREDADNGLPVRATRPITRNTFNEPYLFIAPGQSVSDTSLVWMRFEKVGPAWRIKWWNDGTSEPSTWQFHIEDDTLAGLGDYAPYMSISHNDGATVVGTPTLEVDSLEFYELTEGTVVQGQQATTIENVSAGVSIVDVNVEGSISTTTDVAVAGVATQDIVVDGTSSLTTGVANAGQAEVDAIVEGLATSTSEVGLAGQPVVAAILSGGTATTTEMASAGSTDTGARVVGSSATTTDAGTSGQIAVVVFGSQSLSAEVASGGVAYVESVAEGAQATTQAQAEAGQPVVDVVVLGATAITSETSNAGATFTEAIVEGTGATTTDTASIGNATQVEFVAGTTATVTETASAGIIEGQYIVEGVTASTTDTSSAGQPSGDYIVIGSSTVISDSSNAGQSVEDIVVEGNTATITDSAVSGVASTDIVVLGSEATTTALAHAGGDSNDVVRLGSTASTTETVMAGTPVVDAVLIGTTATTTDTANNGFSSEVELVQGEQASTTALAITGESVIVLEGSSSSTGTVADEGSVVLTTNGSPVSETSTASIGSTHLAPEGQSATTTESANVGGVSVDVVVIGSAAGTTDTAFVGVASETELVAGTKATISDLANSGVASGDYEVVGQQAAITDTANAGGQSGTENIAGQQVSTVDNANAGEPFVEVLVEGGVATETNSISTGNVFVEAVIEGALVGSTDTPNVGAFYSSQSVQGSVSNTTEIAHGGGVDRAVIVIGQPMSLSDTINTGSPIIDIHGNRAGVTDTANVGLLYEKLTEVMSGSRNRTGVFAGSRDRTGSMQGSGGRSTTGVSSGGG